MPANKVRLLALCYFVLAVALRFAPHGVNFSAFCALALFAGCYLTATEGALIALGALALTDTIGHWLDIESMGYYHRPTMFAVYLATALPSLIGWALKKYEIKWYSVFAGAVGSSILFFLVTNFACWLDPMMDYAQTPAGLAECYVKALPFAGNQFLGTILFSAGFFGCYALMQQRAKVTSQA